MKALKRILLVVVVLVAALLIARNMLIRSAAKQAIQKATEFDVEIGGVNAGLFSPTFEITETLLINPEDFPERKALDIRTLRVVYDLPSFFSDEIRLREVVIDVPLAVLVIKEDGDSNLQRLGRVAKPGVTPAPETKDEPKAGGKPAKKMRVDALTLKIGKVEVHQYKEGVEKPTIDFYDVNFDRTAHDVTSFEVVNGMITAAVIENVGARLLKGMSEALKRNEGDLDKAGDELEKTAKEIGKSLKGLLKDVSK